MLIGIWDMFGFPFFSLLSAIYIISEHVQLETALNARHFFFYVWTEKRKEKKKNSGSHGYRLWSQ